MKILQWAVLILGVLCIAGIIWFGSQAKNYDNDKQIEFINLKPVDLSTLDVKIPKLDLDRKTVQESFRELLVLWKKQLPDKTLPKIIFLGTPKKNQYVELIIHNRRVLDCITYMCVSSGMKYCIQDGNIILQSKERDIIEGVGWRTFFFPKELREHLGIDKKFSGKDIIEFFDMRGIKVHEASKHDGYDERPGFITIQASYTDLEKIGFLFDIDEWEKKLWKDD